MLKYISCGKLSEVLESCSPYGNQRVQTTINNQEAPEDNQIGRPRETLNCDENQIIDQTQNMIEMSVIQNCRNIYGNHNLSEIPHDMEDQKFTEKDDALNGEETYENLETSLIFEDLEAINSKKMHENHENSVIFEEMRAIDTKETYENHENSVIVEDQKEINKKEMYENHEASVILEDRQAINSKEKYEKHERTVVLEVLEAVDGE